MLLTQVEPRKKLLINVSRFLNLVWLGYLGLLQNKELVEQVERVQDIVIDFTVVLYFQKWMNLVSLKYLKHLWIKSCYF